MKHTPVIATTLTPPSTPAWRIGCVGYLNAKPLIDGLESRQDLSMHYDVPSRLLETLLSKPGSGGGATADIALCPVVDYHQSPEPLRIVPVGAIGSFGPTLTVRLYSSVPFFDITEVHTDRDSHTSVALLRVILAEAYGVSEARVTGLGTGDGGSQPAALLLIGDKVVADPPDDERYPHQVDLGEAWRRLTGLPFVFAVWMAAADAELGGLPDLLTRQRVANAKRIDQIAEAHAARHGWPVPLARDYLRHNMRYEFGETEMRSVELFCSTAHRMGLLDRLRAVRTTPVNRTNLIPAASAAD